MTTREIYEELREDYEDVLGRLHKEERVTTYLRRIVTDNYIEKIKTAYADKAYMDLFIATHTLKGMAINIGLSQLSAKSSDLCEAVRDGIVKCDLKPLYDDLIKYYESFTSLIDKLEE